MKVARVILVVLILLAIFVSVTCKAAEVTHESGEPQFLDNVAACFTPEATLKVVNTFQEKGWNEAGKKFQELKTKEEGCDQFTGMALITAISPPLIHGKETMAIVIAVSKDGVEMSMFSPGQTPEIKGRHAS